jgi:hypothetical protein
MAKGPPGDPGGGAPRTPSGGFSIDASRAGAERGASATLVSPAGFAAGGGGATAGLSRGGGTAAGFSATLGASGAVPRSAGEGDADSVERLGAGAET